MIQAILFIIALLIALTMLIACAIREGKYQRDEEIRRAYRGSPLETRDWLIGKTDDLPAPYVDQDGADV